MHIRITGKWGLLFFPTKLLNRLQLRLQLLYQKKNSIDYDYDWQSITLLIV
jgi:hypothetical protein